MCSLKRKVVKAAVSVAAPIAAGIIAGEALWLYTDKKLDEYFEAVMQEKTTENKTFDVSKELSAAVASNETVEDDTAGLTYTDEESQMLLKLAMAEAENQGVIGKAIVMNVVHNRVMSEDFPDTVEEVIFEPLQFSVIDDGRYEAAVPDEECYEAL